MKRRTLSLKRETLSDLTGADLTRVVGAASGLTCPVKDCFVRELSDDISCSPSCGHSGCCTINVC